MKYVINGIAILICAGAGALVGWTLAVELGWVGVGGAVIATVVGMVTSTVLFALGIALGKALRLLE